MKYVSFVYLREGSSDDGLLTHFELLLVGAGADEARGEKRDYRGSTLEKLQQFLAEKVDVDVVFVHRDSDSAGLEARKHEIQTARDALEGCPPIIAVVPARCTEAWLLVDEREIRHVAGRPNGSEHLGFPPVAALEEIADPKSYLKDAIGRASGKSGRALADLNKKFDRNRATLLERLNLEGRINELQSWQALCSEVEDFIQKRFPY